MRTMMMMTIGCIFFFVIATGAVSVVTTIRTMVIIIMLTKSIVVTRLLMLITIGFGILNLLFHHQRIWLRHDLQQLFVFTALSKNFRFLSFRFPEHILSF